MGWFGRRRARDPAELARGLYRRAVAEHAAQLRDAAAGTGDGDRRVATNAAYAVGQWHAKVFGEACDAAFRKARLRPPPEPFVAVESAVLIFGDDADREYEDALRHLAVHLGLDPDEVVAADQRRERFVESEGLRRDIADLLGRLRALPRDEASLFASLLLDRAQALEAEAARLGDDPLLGPEVRELVRAADDLRTRAALAGVPLDPRPRET